MTTFLLVVSACSHKGAATPTEYRAALQEVHAALQTAEQIALSPSLGSPPEDFADATNHAADVVRDAAADMDSLLPPGEVAAAHLQLIDGLQAFADDLARLADLENAGSLESMKAFGDDLLNDPDSSLNRIVRAVEEFRRAGYTSATETGGSG